MGAVMNCAADRDVSILQKKCLKCGSTQVQWSERYRRQGQGSLLGNRLVSFAGIQMVVGVLLAVVFGGDAALIPPGNRQIGVLLLGTGVLTLVLVYWLGKRGKRYSIWNVCQKCGYRWRGDY